MAAAAGRVKLREAIDPLVLAVDVGSTASRGDVYDAAGRPVQGGREKVPHHFTTRDDGAMRVLVHSTPRRYRPGSGAIGSTARARCWVELLTTWAVSSAGCSPWCGSYPGTTST